MTGYRIETPSRLHLGLLGWGQANLRQFGGVGLMLNSPKLTIEANLAPAWSANGPLADRTLRIARTIARTLQSEGFAPQPLAFQILESPPEHVGLGTGTQLGLAVASLILASLGEPNLTLDRLATITGRGLRSGIGLYGFQQGGLLVDGGRGPASIIPPLLARLPFPEAWSILLVTPRISKGIHGDDERQAFAKLPPMTDRDTDRLCRLVLLNLLPAVVEQDLPAFGSAVESIQGIVGRAFAPIQGGTTLRPELEPLADHLRSIRLHGIGQSSWGPTLFAFTDADESQRQQILDEMHESKLTKSSDILWSQGSQEGHHLSQFPNP
jgi:beta-ribofuranosylaminobenzene 5'-phosphate synthase